jgi:hypothetical protein
VGKQKIGGEFKCLRLTRFLKEPIKDDPLMTYLWLTLAMNLISSTPFSPVNFGGQQISLITGG